MLDGPTEIARDRCSKSLEPLQKKKRNLRQSMSAARTVRRHVPIEHHAIPAGVLSGNDFHVNEELEKSRSIFRAAGRLTRKLSKNQRKQIMDGELGASEVAKGLGGGFMGIVPQEDKKAASLLIQYMKEMQVKQYFLSNKEKDQLE